MPSPFPGMNPYLELPVLWAEFHNRLIVAISDALTPQLLPNYYMAVETRSYLDADQPDLLVGIPDAVVLPSPGQLPVAQPQSTATQVRPQQIRLPMSIEVKERYLEVREVGTHAVITVIEVLSPKNKRSGEGRTAYEQKRLRILGSASHLVEIDLLRGNSPMLMLGVEQPSDYRIIISRAESRPVADLYSFCLTEPISDFILPLKAEGEGIEVKLQQILFEVYERGGYAFRLDYRQPVPPPQLSPTQQAWVDAILMPLRGD
jgi:hypothetical protein